MKFTKTLAAIAAASLAVSSLAVSAFAAWDGADANGNLVIDMATLVPEGTDISEVYGVKVTFTDASVAVLNEGAGGGFILSSASNNWNQLQWCNGCGDAEAHDIQWNADDNSITRMEEKPFFTAEDISGADGTYGQLALSEWWGGDIAYSKIELLDKDGKVLGAADEEPADEAVTAEIAYTDGATPSYTYTVSGENTTGVLAKVTVSPADGDKFGWNDWCGAGVAVKSEDGTVKYYQYGGKSVNWDWGTEDEDGNEIKYSIGGIDGETWLGTVDAENGGEILIPAKSGDVVEFYCLSWDSYDGVQYTLAISEVAENDNVDPNPGESSGEVPEEPVEPGESEDPVEPVNPGESSGKPVNPDSGVAVAVVPAALAAAAVATAGIVLKKRSK